MRYHGLRILVTGGAGFIGAHLVHKLLQLGSKVTVVDNFSKGRRDNLGDLEDTVNIVKGDVREYGTIKTVIKNQDIVFHLAASSSVPMSTERPLDDFTCNALGTVNVLNAAREINTDIRVVFASSAAVYGGSSAPVSEDAPLIPCSIYGQSKLVGESYCKMFCKIYSIPITILRYFNVYGPLQQRYVIYDLLRKLQKNPKELEVLGSGEQIRDFIYISDCVDATLGLDIERGATGEVFNIGTGKATRIKELVELLLGLLKLNEITKVVYTGKSWVGDPSVLIADITKLRAYGFEPRVKLKDGVISLINSFFHHVGGPHAKV